MRAPLVIQHQWQKADQDATYAHHVGDQIEGRNAVYGDEHHEQRRQQWP